MFKLADCNIGDVWPFWDEAGEVLHLYFLQAPFGEPKNWHIGHAVSRDFRHWEYCGVVLSPGAAGSFDDRGLATGSVIAARGRYYMPYTAHANHDMVRCGTVGMAVSDDLYIWQKLPGPVITLEPKFYESQITGSRPFLHWRDPFVCKIDDLYHLFLCARSLTGPVKTRGAVAHFTSGDLQNWQALPPLKTTPFCEEMECPLVFEIEGKWYLFFSTVKELLPPEIYPAQVREGGGFYQFADALDGQFRVKKTGKIEVDIPGYFFYAPQFFRCRGKYYYIGTLYGPDEPTFVSDIIELAVNDGEITVKA